MRIIYDNIIFALQNSGGISVYWKELVNRLEGTKYKKDYIHYKNENNVEWRKLVVHGSNKRKIPLIIDRYLSPRCNTNNGPAIFHSSYYRSASYNEDVATILTIHDFVYEYDFIKGIIGKILHLRQKKKSIKDADGIICISKNTKRDLLFFYPFAKDKKIKVIYNGVSESFFKIEEPIILPHRFLQLENKKFILYIGKRIFYKNFDLIVEALRERKDLYLVMVGGISLAQKEQHLLNIVLGDRYFQYMNISNEELNILYNLAFCFVYPSRYEGFGIPIIEAMKSGCPVIASDIEVFNEVAGDSALYFNYKEKESLLAAFLELEDDKTRMGIIQKGFSHCKKYSWNKCFRETNNFYYEIYQSRFGKSNVKD